MQPVEAESFLDLETALQRHIKEREGEPASFMNLEIADSITQKESQHRSWRFK